MGLSLGIGIGISKAQGAPWSPLQLDNCEGWWRADQGITIATGVSQWDDLSGNGRHLTQGTGGAQPAYNADGGPNDQPYIAFDGVDDYLRDTFTLVQPEFAWAVVIPSASNTVNDTVFDGSGLNTMRLFVSAAATLRLFAGASGPAAASTLTAWQRVECLFDGASSTISVAGGSDVTGNAGTNVSNGLVLGCHGGLAGFADSRVAEMGLLSAAPPADDRANLGAYLVGRYGVL